MGRKSALTDKQWQEIEKRLLAGEAVRVLAREFGVSDTAIRKRVGLHANKIKDVANQMVRAEIAFSELPISSQIKARTLADELKEVSMHLAGAAKYGSATAHRLHAVAHSRVQLLDDTDPLSESGIEVLKGIAALTKTANEASQIGMGLLAANREMLTKQEAAQDLPTRIEIVPLK